MSRRDEIRGALERAGTFVGAQEVYAVLRRAGHRVGLATVYRHLQALAGEGAVDVLRGDDGETRYRSCETRRHHHHLVCRRCGRTLEIEASPVERWAGRVAAEHGFVDIAHTVEVFGTCATCVR